MCKLEIDKFHPYYIFTELRQGFTHFCLLIFALRYKDFLLQNDST